MAFIYDTGTPVYKKWAGKERPEFGQRGDLVRYKKQEWILCSWDSETGEQSTILSPRTFEFDSVAPSRLTFVKRLGGNRWWERLPEAGDWSGRLSSAIRAAKAKIVAQVAVLQEIEREAEARARRHWSEEEIERAKNEQDT